MKKSFADPKILRAATLSGLFLLFISINALWPVQHTVIDRNFRNRYASKPLPFPEILSTLLDGDYWRQWTAFVKDPTLPVRRMVFQVTRYMAFEAISLLPDDSPGVFLPPYVLMQPDQWLYSEVEAMGCWPDAEIQQFMTGMEDIADILRRHGKELYFFATPSKMQGMAASKNWYIQSLSSCADRNRQKRQEFYDASPYSHKYSYRDFLPLTQRLSAIEPVYWQMDRHWNWFGQMQALQFMVNTIAPGAAIPSQIQERGLRNYKPDIVQRALYLPITEPTSRYIIDPALGPLDKTELARMKGWPVKHFQSRGPGPWIAGKTVLLTDSFFYYMGDNVAYYFQDLTIFYIDQMPSELFQSAIRQADRLIIAPVEFNMTTLRQWIGSPGAAEFWQGILAGEAE